MKAYEYIAEVLSDGHLSIPDNIKQQIKPSEKVRVMLLLEDEDAVMDQTCHVGVFAGLFRKGCHI